MNSRVYARVEKSEAGTVLDVRIFTLTHLFMYVWNKENWYSSRCTCIHVNSHVDASVQQGKLVRFCMYV